MKAVRIKTCILIMFILSLSFTGGGPKPFAGDTVLISSESEQALPTPVAVAKVEHLLSEEASQPPESNYYRAEQGLQITVPALLEEYKAAKERSLSMSSEGSAQGDFALYLPVSSKTNVPSQILRLNDCGMACLTFDDGYSRSSIVRILDCLKENDVKCTFFVIGSCLKLYGDLWRQAAADGHEIAYHTMSHGNLNNKSNTAIKRDIERWNERAFEILGSDYKIPKLARAPGGRANERVRQLFDSLGYKLIYWSSDTFTGVYKSNHSDTAQRIASYLIKRTKEGSISLQHFNKYDSYSLPLYLNELKGNVVLGRLSDAMRLLADDYVISGG